MYYSTTNLYDYNYKDKYLYFSLGKRRERGLSNASISSSNISPKYKNKRGYYYNKLSKYILKTKDERYKYNNE